MLPFIFAILSAVAAEIVFEDRHPLQISGGWIWMARGIHMTAFFIIAGLIAALVQSYI